jgi:hypothetical protein
MSLASSEVAEAAFVSRIAKPLVIALITFQWSCGHVDVGRRKTGVTLSAEGATLSAEGATPVDSVAQLFLGRELNVVKSLFIVVPTGADVSDCNKAKLKSFADTHSQVEWLLLCGTAFNDPTKLGMDSLVAQRENV